MDYELKHCTGCQEEYTLPEDCDICPICGEIVDSFDDWASSQEEPLAVQ